MLFALLAVLAPALDAPLAGNELEEYVSAPADTRGDAATLVSAMPGVAEDVEEEADQEEAVFAVLARLPCVQDADHQATDAWLPSFPRPSSHPCTGPPTL